MYHYLNNQDKIIMREVPEKNTSIKINIPEKYINYNCGMISVKEFLLNILTNEDQIELNFEPKYIEVTPKEAILLILDNPLFSTNEKINKINC